ncbi:transposase [Bacillus cereus]|nr:transposase [Bacillus cereus]
MSMIMLANGKRKPTVFKAYYDRKVEEGMIKKKAISHLCGKIANLIYTILKNSQKYDPKIHAAACGIEWDEVYKLEKYQETLLLN